MYLDNEERKTSFYTAREPWYTFKSGRETLLNWQDEFEAMVRELGSGRYSNLGASAANIKIELKVHANHCTLMQKAINSFLLGLRQAGITIRELDEQAANVLENTVSQFQLGELKTVINTQTKNINLTQYFSGYQGDTGGVMGDAGAGSALNTTSGASSLSAVPDANGNMIDLDNFQQIPLSTKYVELNDPTRQKVMFAVGENLDAETAKYWEDAGYPLDGFGILGIGCGESGGKQGSNLLFGTDGGSGNGTSVGEKTINKGVDVVAASLLQTGVASTQAEAENMAKNDYFYKQLSALVGCARNAKNDGVQANVCWGVLNPNSTNLRDSVPRWRNNYQNGTVDAQSGGTGTNGGRYTFWSNPI